LPLRRHGPYDIPLKRDASGRFLPWIIALMAFLATLALAASMMLSDLAARWTGGLSDSLTIQVTPLPASADAAPLDQRVQALLDLLAGEPAVREASALPREEALALVEPWLGHGALAGELPLPVLVDVRLHPGADIPALAGRVEARLPGLSVEDPGTWLADLRRLAGTVQAVSLGILVLIGGAAVVAVLFAASAGFAAHRGDVELLHVLGASDAYVAGQFQRHMLRLALVGAGGGTVLALGVLWLMAGTARRLEAALLPDLTLTPPQWLILLLVPVLAGLLSALTARVTVLRALARLP